MHFCSSFGEKTKPTHSNAQEANCMTDFHLPPLGTHDRCDDQVPATITVARFVEAFQISSIKIDANESVTIVRLYQGTVYVAQNRNTDAWTLGSMTLIDFLNALESSGSTKIPGKIHYLLTYNIGNKFEVGSFEEMAACMGWDGVCP